MRNDRPCRRGGRWGGVALLLASATSPAFSAPEPDFTVNVELTPKAAAALEAAREAMVLMVDYYGWPKKGAESHGDEVGRIDFGPDKVIGVPGKAGRYGVPAETLDPERLGWIEGPVYVSVGIASARLSGSDNLLACESLDEPLADARKAVATIRCGLIYNDPDSPLN